MSSNQQMPRRARAPVSLATLLASTLAALSVVALLVASVFQIVLNYHAQRQVVAARQELAAAKAAGDVAGVVEQVFRSLEAAAQISQLTGGTPAERQLMLQSLLKLQPTFREVSLINSRGNELAKESRDTVIHPSDLTSQTGTELFKQVSKNSNYISSLHLAANASQPRITVAVPIRGILGDFEGALSAEVSVKFMWETVASLRIGQKGQAYVVDRQGQLIATQDPSRVVRQTTAANLPKVAEFMRSRPGPSTSGTDVGPGLDGSRQLATYVSLGVPDWAVVVETPLAEAYQPLVRNLTLSAAGAMLIALLAAGLGCILSRRLAAPMVRLTETATQIADGHLELSVPVRGTAEVRRLADAFNAMTGRLRETIQSLEQRLADLRHAQHALQEKSEELDRYFSNALDLLCIADTEGRFRRLNPEWETTLGYTLEELQGVRFLDFVHPDDIERTIAAVNQLAQQKSVLNFVNRYRAKDGNYHWIEWRSLPVGNLIYAAARDITERKLAEAALRENEERLRLALAGTNQGLYDLNLQSGEAHVSPEYLRMLGYEPGEVTTSSHWWSRQVHPDDLELASHTLQDCIQGRLAEYRMEYRLRSKNGDWKWVMSLGRVVATDQQGRPTRMLGTHTDITERKRAEQALHESDARLSKTTENAPGMICQFLLRPDGSLCFPYASSWCETMFGIEPGMLRADARPLLNLILPEDRPGFDESVAHSARTQELWRWEGRLRSVSGEIVWHQGISKPERLPDRSIQWNGIFFDTTERKRAEEALRESEQRFRAVVENAQAIIFMLDRRGVFRLSEGQGLAALGLRPGQVVGQPALELYRNAPSVLAGIQRALAGESNRTTNRLGDLVFDTVYSPYYTPEGEQDGVVGVAIDITERTRAEVAAKESQQRLALALEGANLGSWDWNILTGEVRVNERWAQMLGYRVDDFQPHVRSWETRVHPDDMPGVRQVLQAHLEGRTLFYETEHRMRHKAGHWVWVLDRGKVIERDAQGKPVRATGTHLDITDRKQAEAALEESRRMLRLVLDTIPVRVFWKDREGRYLGCNQSFAHDAGFDSPEDLLGKTDLDMGWKEQAALYRADDDLVMTSGEPKLHYEEPQTTREGKVLWLRTSKIPLRNLDGQTIGVLGSYEDITERKRAEQERAQLTDILTASLNEIYLFDAQSLRFVYLNEGALRNLGYALEQALELTPLDIKPEFTVASFAALVEPLRQHQQTQLVFETWHRRADHSVYPVEVHLQLFERDNGSVFLAVIQDITERRRAEAALRASKALYHDLVETSQDLIWQCDAEGRYTYLNPAWEQVLGYCLDEMLGRHFTEFLSPEHAPSNRALFARLLTGESVKGHESTHRRKDGKEVLLVFNAKLVQGQDGRPAGTRGTAYDVTERKRAELILQASLEEKEALLREVHHRVKNNLQIVSSLLSLKASRERNEAALTALRDTQARVRAMAVLHEMLYRSGNLAWVDFGGYVEHLCAQLARAFGQGAGRIEVRVQMPKINLGLEQAVPCGLIVSEAVTNAFKHAFAQRNDGQIDISARCTEERQVELVIADNGIGLAPGFEPGQTATLGLQLVSRLTQQLDGRLRIERDPGTRLVITFPVVKRTLAG